MSDLDKQIDDLRTELAGLNLLMGFERESSRRATAESESKIQALEATIAEQAEALEAKRSCCCRKS